MNFAEKRKTERFIGAIPVEFEQGMGITRDYSAYGVYFVTDQLLSVGQQLDFVMKFSNTDPFGPNQLRCSGVVVRVEPALKTLGVAVSVTTHMFEDVRGEMVSGERAIY